MIESYTNWAHKIFLLFLSLSVSYNLHTYINYSFLTEYSVMENISLSVKGFTNENINIDELNFKINEKTASNVVKNHVIFSSIFISVISIIVIRYLQAMKSLIIINYNSRKLSEHKKTFVNLMVLMDCCISVAHIPILAQYF